MLNALDNLPEDPVELRRVTELLASEVKAQALMIEKLQHQLHGANRHRFESKSEGMDQLQLFAENEEIAEAAVKAAETAPAEPIELKEKGRVASITGQARSTLTRENGQPTDSNLAQPSSVILLRARTPICASVF